MSGTAHTDPAGRRRRRWPDAVPPVLFFGWMYGTALLLLLGLLNQLTWMGDPTHTLRGDYYAAGLVIAFTLPVAGIAVAVATRRRQWLRRFGVAIGCAFVALLLVGTAWSAGGAAEVRDDRTEVRDDPAQPTQSPDRCYTISGGTNTCPGG